MQSPVNELVIESQSRGLKVNFSKTKMTVMKKSNTHINITITKNDNNLEQFNIFMYLVSNSNEEDSCENEIKTRISIAKDLFNKI